MTDRRRQREPGWGRYCTRPRPRPAQERKGSDPQKSRELEQPRGKHPTHAVRPQPIMGKNDQWASASQHWCPTEPTVYSRTPNLEELMAGRAAGTQGCQEGTWLGPVHCFRPPATQPRWTATAQTPAGHGARREPPSLKAGWPGLAR